MKHSHKTFDIPETMKPQTNEKTNKKRKKINGCGCAFLLFVVFVILFCIALNLTEFGENEATLPIFCTEKGSNFSYYLTYSRQCCEFTISERDFLEWCKERWGESIDIVTLPSLPKDNRRYFERTKNEFPIINEQREVPLLIGRYSYIKPEHEKCWAHEKCQVDPTGKTDVSCCHFVDDGYYYEERYQDCGGVYILYDRSNQRCYIVCNRR